jgi:superfamily II DNA or RNA helicase
MTSKYPKVTDDNFYTKINNIYDDYKIPNKKQTMKEICNPKEYKLQLPQKFIADFISPKTDYMGILVNHRIGSGKTCTAIRVGEKWKKYKRIVVVVPASLKTNFRNELRSQCAGNEYLSENNRKELLKLNPNTNRYKEIIKESDEKINNYYEIYSYNKFVELITNKTINLKNSILIVDEIQNMISEEGIFYDTLYNTIHESSKSLRVILLSATPMFDKPSEIALTMNLLQLPKKLPIGNDFYKTFIKITTNKKGEQVYSTKNIDLFKEYVRGFISFFRGAPSIAFPELKIRYVECEMSKFQYSAYKNIVKNEEFVQTNKKIKSIDIVDLPNNFYIGTRMISNVVFPNMISGEKGMESLTNRIIKNNLSKYSCKFSAIINKIKGGKIFIFSSFKEYGGIASMQIILDSLGYKNYLTDGPGPKRYAIWSGDESIAIKENIKTVFNRLDNIDGKQIKILLGSPSIREGVSLTNVRQVHILEPYWNRSRLEQVIGRASRYCSHKDLPEEKRVVKVFIYIAISPLDQENIETVDQYIYKLANEKDKLIKIFNKAIKEAAVDCHLNKNSTNQNENEEKIKCEK